jgi:hypothetical protein
MGFGAKVRTAMASPWRVGIVPDHRRDAEFAPFTPPILGGLINEYAPAA